MLKYLTLALGLALPSVSNALEFEAKAKIEGYNVTLNCSQQCDADFGIKTIKDIPYTVVDDMFESIFSPIKGYTVQLNLDLMTGQFTYSYERDSL